MTSPHSPRDTRRHLHLHSADGTRIHARVHGPEQGPTVVLVHGWTCSVDFWDPVVALLPDTVRVVCYDQRGHGHSALPHTTGYSTTALADDLCAVLTATLAPGSRAVVAGHSMGAMTLMAAARRPELRERAAALLLASTGAARLVEATQVLPISPRWPRLRAAGHRALLSTPLPLGPVTPLSRAALRYAIMGPYTPRATVDRCARIVHACPPAARVGWGRVLASLDLEDMLADVVAPSVVMAGTADRLTPPTLARRIAEHLPACEQLIEPAGIGHMTPLEAPTTVSQTITDLVDRHLRPPRQEPTESVESTHREQR
ncbi:alpha/beta fold hydrolase [Salinactinospora qingdaonensis]|uniref:Alpha/beta hydrolase n=1 Tax=Salinactinospora qingdaonensis TaxID=702744 RepID=A0ABP7G8H6_9ACTN